MSKIDDFLKIVKSYGYGDGDCSGAKDSAAMVKSNRAIREGGFPYSLFMEALCKN